MAVITMIGGHSTGKSTAVLRWKERYPAIEVYSLDDLRKEYYANEAKVELIRSLKSRDIIAVVESAKGYSAWMKELSPTDPVILVGCSDVKLSRERMERRRDGPLTDWWTDRSLHYENCQKFINFAAKNLDPAQSKFFDILDRERDWEAVDEYFGSVYRRLHNELVRKRRRE